MKQLRYLGDVRFEFGYCCFCGEETETRDHLISKVFLDNPYPKDLPTIAACFSCNNGYSLDEEYVACLVECAMSGSENFEDVKREKIRKILERKPKLSSKLGQAKLESHHGISFYPEKERVENIIIKLAKGLAAFEFNEPKLEDPSQLMIVPFAAMMNNQLKNFEDTPRNSLLPEVGTRAMQRWIINWPTNSQWVNVQNKRFRFLTIPGDSLIIRMVISEYLACEVVWN